MDIVGKYAKLIKKKAERRPGAAFRLLKIGLLYERTHVGLISEKKIPKAYTRLNVMALDSVRQAMKHPETSVWVNLFAPVEILQCFGLRPLSIECFSSFMAGFRIEDYFINYAERMGMADTLCSYHKNFVGVVDSRVLPRPKMALTTTLACDCNVNTFRYIQGKLGVPAYVIDIPYEYSAANEAYVAEQLREYIAFLEKETGKTFRQEALAEILDRENRCREYHREFLRLQASKYYPCTMTLHMFKLFASHLLPGSPEVLEYYRLLVEDVKKYPDSDAVKILWVHLLPFYQETLKSYFNCNPAYQIIGSDFDFDYSEQMDTSRPVEALARKLLLSIYNGPYERKIQAVKETLELLKPDGVIHLCHWGCKQSSGGVMELKKALRELDMPMLILDGDGMDRRNSHDGQVKTRTEAFLEMVGKRKEGKKA